MNLKETAKRLNTEIPALFFAMKSKETPFIAKIFAGITVVYALSPIDLIPDFIPVLGYLDDVILLPLLIVLTIKFIPKDTFEYCKQQSEGIWKDGKPKRWYYAIPFFLIWTFILFILIKVFFRRSE